MSLSGKIIDKKEGKNYILSILNKKRSLSLFSEGGSMKPILPDKSEIIIDRNLDLVKRGDIVIYLRNDTLIVHRVIRVIKDKYLTKGDSALRFDSPLVSAEELVGIVKVIIKDNRVINLEKKRWRAINHTLTMASLVEGALIKILTVFVRFFHDGIKRYVFYKKRVEIE